MRLLTEQDFPQSWDLSRLAFGGDRNSTPTPPTTPEVGVGAFDDHGRLVGRAIAFDYSQWWGGRPVPMAGVAGVAVHPDARGQGLVRQLMDALVAECEQPISVLFPTAPALYRRLGWEIVGTLDHTPVALSALPRGRGEVRAATEADFPVIQALYDARAAQGNGLLTRTGCRFPDPAKDVFECDVVTLAVEDGAVTGYVSYDRGRGYRGGAQLRVWDCVTASATALQTLLGSLASWDSVADTVLWRGPTADLALQLPGSVPPPTEVQPWMLRVLDPVAAVAARGFGQWEATASFAVEGKGYRLEVADGRGALTPIDARDLPALAGTGLALLFAGVAQGRLVRLGLLDRPVAGLETAFSGPVPEILDYF